MKKTWVGALLVGAMLAAAPSAALAETVTVDFGNPVVSVDADQYIMQEVAAVNAEGEFLVPVRDVAQAFNGTVEYSGADSTVKLSFPNGNWATIELGGSVTGSVGTGEEALVTTAVMTNDHLYVSADLMARLLGGKVEMIDYGHDEVFRLIFYVRK